MSNYEYLKSFIKNASGKENILAVNKVYIKFMDSLEGGVLLSQMIYYSDKSSRKDGYFWKSYKEWYEETFISEYNVKKIVNKMKEHGYLETKLIKANGNPTLHYKFDTDAFISVFGPFLKKLSIENENIDIGNENINVSLTKSTTEITTKKDIKDNVQQVEQEFEKIWTFYPRKVKKQEALDKFIKAVKKDGLEKVIEGTLSFAKVQELNKTDKKFIPHASTFFHQRIYLDDMEEHLQKNTNSANNSNGNSNQSTNAASIMFNKFKNGGFNNETSNRTDDRILISENVRTL